MDYKGNMGFFNFEYPASVYAPAVPLFGDGMEESFTENVAGDVECIGQLYGGLQQG